MRWLRGAWLFAIVCGLAIAAGSALIMRFELLDPEPTLDPELYSHAFAVHGIGSLAVLLAALLAIPALVLKPGRGSAVLGFLALGLWAGAIALLVGLELHGAQEWQYAKRGVLLALAVSQGLGASQIAVSLRANADRSSRAQLVVAVGGLVAIATVVIPLVGGSVPTSFYELLATTAIASGLVYDASTRGARSFAVLATVPCLVLAWAATALLHAVHSSYFHDTVAIVSPLPLIGSALLGALLLAATRWRSPQPRFAHVAAGLIASGSSLTSLGFFLLGWRGMPRRYLAYAPQFQPLQIFVGAAAVIAVIGCVVAVEAFRRGPRIAGHALAATFE